MNDNGRNIDDRATGTQFEPLLGDGGDSRRRPPKDSTAPKEAAALKLKSLLI